MSNTHQMKLTCGCLVEAEVSHDWIDEKTTLDDVFILDYCPKHAAVDELLATLKKIEWDFEGECPLCIRHKDIGHNPDCEVGNAIAKAEGT